MADRSLIAVQRLKPWCVDRGRFPFVWEADLQGQEAPSVDADVQGSQELIFRMVLRNPNVGAPRIHRRVYHARFDVSERTISSDETGARDPEQAKGDRLPYSAYHREEEICSRDFFTFRDHLQRDVFAFSVISHDSRRIRHSMSPKHPTSVDSSSRLREVSIGPLGGSSS